MTRPKIAVFGVFGVGNFGNEATLEAYLAQLRAMRPGVVVVGICTRPQQAGSDRQMAVLSMDSSPTKPAGNGIAPRLLRRLVQIRPITGILRWTNTLAQIRTCDALVIPGTGILDDFATPPSGLPYHLFRWCFAAWLCRLPVRFIAVGAGPIINPTSRRLMTWAARLADHRSFRDEESREFVRTLGINTAKDAVVPDLVFSHPHASCQSPRENDGKIRVGLGVMTYFGWRGRESEGRATFEAYILKMAQFTRWLLGQGLNVSLLIGEANDKVAVDALLRALKCESGPSITDRVTARGQSSMSDFLDEVVDLDVVVVTRFHNVVGALSRGKPVISIRYASKNDRLMEDFNLGKFCQQIDTLDVAKLIVQFTELLARKTELSAQIASRASLHRETVIAHLRTWG